jgi:hypothetical protein
MEWRRNSPWTRCRTRRQRFTFFQSGDPLARIVESESCRLPPGPARGTRNGERGDAQPRPFPTRRGCWRGSRIPSAAPTPIPIVPPAHAEAGPEAHSHGTICHLPTADPNRMLRREQCGARGKSNGRRAWRKPSRTRRKTMPCPRLNLEYCRYSAHR